jgi:hypothetical protein
MSDDIERSVASAGSQPVAWAVTIGPPGDLSVYEAFADHQKDEAISLARECLFGETNRPLPLAPLYFAPTLTDEERKAIAWFSIYSDTPGEEPHAAVLANLLERTK